VPGRSGNHIRFPDQYLALLFVQNSHPPTGDEIVSANTEWSLATTSA
jgi:hypothetical protein